jgi:hypothetical protein
MNVSQNEQNENGNVLYDEIKSWKAFRYVLREESVLLFDKMLSECGHNEDYIMTVRSKR